MGSWTGSQRQWGVLGEGLGQGNAMLGFCAGSSLWLLGWMITARVEKTHSALIVCQALC